MAAQGIPEFLSSLENSQLLTDAQFKQLREQLIGNPLTAESLANVLVSQNHLTQWQAKQLLKGQSGFILNQYRLLNPVGRGGMGHVFRGRNSRTNAVVAVKVMAKKLTRNQTLVSRFRREIRACAKLDSPHIVRSMDAGRVGKTDFMVMEYVNGDQVDRIANRLGRVPVGLSCDIIRQVAVGLQHAHEHNMVHRDIKPGNMMVHWEESGQGIVKLMDMGLVLLMSDDDPDENTVTRAGQVMGTPDYMSPEQGWDTTQVDIRSDIYSLGCTLFRLLTGTVPFSGTNPLQVLSQRLQRDAPAIDLVRDDIPADVVAIVSKMTARDPDARYQVPEEVVEALSHVSEPLTFDALRKAARDVTNDPNADISTSNDEDVDETDGTYRQFLKDVQSGSAVNLMLTTDASDSPVAATIPGIDINVTPRTTSRRRESVATPRRGRKTAFTIMSIVGAAVLGLIVLVVSGDNEESDRPPVTKQVPVTKTPTATISPPAANVASTDEVWTHQVEAKIVDATGKITFELGSSAPPKMMIDSDSGKISWPIPPQQSPGDYSIPVSVLHEADGSATTIAETVIPLTVKAGFSSIRLPEHRPLELAPGELFSISMATDAAMAAAFDLRYKLDGRAPSGLSINETTGTLQWRPKSSELGRHLVTVVVYKNADPKLRKASELNLIVLPTHINDVLPPLVTQEAVAGATFNYELPGPNLSRAPRMAGVRVMLPGPGAPIGFSVNPRTNEVTWEVPSDASGIVKVPLVARLDGTLRGDRELQGTAILEINIVPSAPPEPTMKMPPAAEIAAAQEELKATYTKSIAQARTTADKAALASRLLEQSFDAKPDVADAALLQLIEQDLANRARAADVLFEIAQIRATRYGLNELDAAESTLKSLRKTSLNQRQQDLVVEHCLRLAKKSVAAERFELTEDLLQAVELLLGRGTQGMAAQFAGDVTTARKIATELTRATEGTVDTFKLNELGRLIDRWQFQRVFQKGAGFSYVQFSPAGTAPLLADNGRSLWTVTSDMVRLKTTTQATVVAMADNTEQPDRYVLRFEMSADSNCMQLVFGVVGTAQDDFNAYRVILDSSGMGQIQSLQPPKILNDPAQTVTPSLYPDQSNLVEFIVDGTQVVARINGAVVSQAMIPELQAGRLGISADLRRSDPQLSIRRLRILRLPAAE